MGISKTVCIVHDGDEAGRDDATDAWGGGELSNDRFSCT
jgi:hypothetical protein